MLTEEQERELREAYSRLKLSREAAMQRDADGGDRHYADQAEERYEDLAAYHMPAALETIAELRLERDRHSRFAEQRHFDAQQLAEKLMTAALERDAAMRVVLTLDDWISEDPGMSKSAAGRLAVSTALRKVRAECPHLFETVKAEKD